MYFRPVKMGDPLVFRRIRQGILQYAILKPLIALIIIALKENGSYNEGEINLKSAFLWTNLFYNISVCVALYCLILFYQQCSQDLARFRPLPKFICVKSIIFLTFWQGLLVSFLVYIGLIGKGMIFYN